jgi:aminoglycoside phosphotransferase (APT) family kinase protein
MKALLQGLSARLGREYRAHPMGKKTHNGVYAVESRDGGERFVLKTYHTRWKQAHEIFAMNALREVVPVPEAVERGVLTEGSGAQTPFLLMTRLPGETVDAVWASLRAAERRALVKNAGLWLRRMHDALPMSFIGVFDEHGQSRGGYFSGWGDYLAGDAKRWHGVMAREERLSAEDLQLIEAMTCRVASQQAVLNECRDSTFLHRDYGVRNLLISGTGELSGVIDFEHGIAGEPLFDLVRMIAETLYAEEDLFQLYTKSYLARPLQEAEHDRICTYLAHHAVSQFGYGWREGADEEVAAARNLMRWVQTQR